MTVLMFKMGEELVHQKAYKLILCYYDTMLPGTNDDGQTILTRVKPQPAAQTVVPVFRACEELAHRTAWTLVLNAMAVFARNRAMSALNLGGR